MRRIPRILVLVAIGALFSACPADMWIPIQVAPRAPVSFDHVAFLDEIPSKPFEVIGIITPPNNEYDTEAEAVKAMRRVAASHGADAVFIEERSAGEGWSFKGMKGGSFTTREIRAKAIVWK